MVLKVRLFRLHFQMQDGEVTKDHSSAGNYEITQLGFLCRLVRRTQGVLGHVMTAWIINRPWL